MTNSENSNPYQQPEHQAGEPKRRPTNWFRWFRRGFLWWGAFPTLLTILTVSSGKGPGLFILLTAGWWLVGLTLVFHKKAGFFTAFTIVSGLWLLGCFLTVRRIMFVIENQGMERADGFGSPLAFLIGLIFEQCFLFVPMTILFGLGIAAIRSACYRVGKES